MRDAVRDAFYSYTAPKEGAIPHLYQDIRGLVTVGLGILVDPMPMVLPLPLLRADGAAANDLEKRAEWLRIKSLTDAARYGHRYAAQYATLHLDEDGIRSTMLAKLDTFDAAMRQRFPAWDDWPADAQLATLSHCWACGAGFRFPRLDAALRRRDWATAAVECRMDETGNPGLAPRNRDERQCYLNAAGGGDPDVLVWAPDSAGSH